MSMPMGSGMGAGAAAAASASNNGTNLPGFHDVGALNEVQTDPRMALAWFQRANGGADRSSNAGKRRDSIMARALQAYLNAIGVGGLGGGQTPFAAADAGAQEFMKQYQAGGGGVSNFLQQAAGQVLGGNANGAKGVDFSAMENNDEIMNILNLVTGLTQFGAPTMATYGTNSALTRLQEQADDQYFDGGGKTPVLGQPGGGADTFRQLIQRYLAVK